MSDPVVISGMSRTPIGSFQGVFSEVSAPDLGGVAIRGALEGCGVSSADVSETMMGCVLPAGVGQAPARQAARKADVPVSSPAVTINKMCGSGMQAAIMAHSALHVREGDVIVAGGMESMTNAPHLLPKSRTGLRLGHGQVVDHMFVDGLEDAYDRGSLMGVFAENTAEKYQFTREEQDAFAIESLNRAIRANDDGTFDSEIRPVSVTSRKGETTVSRDEQPFAASAEKIPRLKPAFRKDGTVTAANSSSISDGAAALVMMRRSEADRRAVPIRAVIRSVATHAHEPEWFTTAPVGAIRKVLESADWSASDVDLYEVNEAFAAVSMAAMRDIGISRETLNVHGGACALGHPIGASGARILVTLISALEKYDLRRGVASLCIGGGEATAIAVERP